MPISGVAWEGLVGAAAVGCVLGWLAGIVARGTAGSRVAVGVIVVLAVVVAGGVVASVGTGMTAWIGARVCTVGVWGLAGGVVGYLLHRTWSEQLRRWVQRNGG
jgi:hypothetical protein